MAKKKHLEPIDSPGAVADRFRHLWRTLFQGSQTEMADAINCSQAAVSRILNGRQPPGERILARLATHKNVNPEWLYHGTGEPTPSRIDPEVERWLLPIVGVPLSGPSRASSKSLRTETLAAPPSHYSPTRYWLRVGHNDNILRAQALGIHADDLLLIETDPEIVERSIRTSEQGIGVVRSDDRKTAALAEVNLIDENEEESECILANEFTYDPQARTWGLRIGGDRKPTIVELRGMKRSNLSSYPVERRIRVADLVGIVVLLLRQSWEPTSPFVGIERP